MAKITWVGSDDPMEPHTSIWNGVTFERGKPIDVTDEHMIKKARVHPHYAVKEATNGEAKGGQGQEEKEEQEEYPSKDKTDYPPVKKKRHRRKKKKEPEPGDASGDHRPADDA